MPDKLMIMANKDDMGCATWPKSWKVKHLKRVYNTAAHDLAQVAKASGISQLWRDSEPPIIQRALLVDRAKC